MFFRSNRNTEGAAAPLILDTAPAPGLFAGTKVATYSKWMDVEDLQEGDEVLTAENGAQPLTHVDHGLLSVSKTSAAAKHWPLLFPEGALGNETALTISPSMRLAVEHRAAAILFGEHCVGVKAEAFIGYRGITRARDVGDLTHVTLQFDAPQTVAVEGGVFLDLPGSDNSYRFTPLNDRQSRLLTRYMAEADAQEHKPTTSATWI